MSNLLSSSSREYVEDKLSIELESLTNNISSQFSNFASDHLSITENYEGFINDVLMQQFLTKLQSEFAASDYETAVKTTLFQLEQAILNSKLENTNALDVLNCQCLIHTYHRFKQIVLELCIPEFLRPLQPISKAEK